MTRLAVRDAAHIRGPRHTPVAQGMHERREPCALGCGDRVLDLGGNLPIHSSCDDAIGFRFPAGKLTPGAAQPTDNVALQLADMSSVGSLVLAELYV